MGEYDAPPYSLDKGSEFYGRQSKKFTNIQL